MSYKTYKTYNMSNMSDMSHSLESYKSYKLRKLPVLIVDCQTTGPTPKKGHLLELAWTWANLKDNKENQVHSCIVALPDGETMPRQVERITGIGNDELENADEFEEVSLRFVKALNKTSSDEVLVVAHYARFETRFLKHLVANNQSSIPIMNFVCTYELARRLVPDLPKHTLRAVSGFLGHSLKEKRRAADHVRATVIIWKELLKLLAEQEGMNDLAGLMEYLGASPPSHPKKKRYGIPKEQRSNLPPGPGVYRFLDRDGNELYVGKATNLKQRVSSYFTGAASKAGHILEMLSGAHNLTFEQTDTALEAALLEADTIKKIDPPYNKSLRSEDPHLWYFNPGLTESSNNWSPDFPLGPFPSKMPFSALKALHIFLSEPNENGGAEVLREHVVDVLDKETLRSGAELFKELYLIPGSTVLSYQRLISLGWIMNQREKIETDDGGEELEIEEPKEVQKWDVSRTVRYCLAIVSMAARYCQRAAWYKMLGESTLIWETSKGPDEEQKRQLHFRKYQTTEAADPDVIKLKSEIQLVSPEGPSNRTQYDRMRVLTTEIRRLLSQERYVEVRIGEESLVGGRLGDVLKGV